MNQNFFVRANRTSRFCVESLDGISMKLIKTDKGGCIAAVIDRERYGVQLGGSRQTLVLGTGIREQRIVAASLSILDCCSLTAAQREQKSIRILN